MANSLERQILIDGHRNAVVKLIGLIDSADVYVTPALQLSDLLNNDPALRLYALRVNECQWSVSNGLVLTLEWNSSNPQGILQLSGQEEIDFCHLGGALPTTTLPGFDGAVNLRTQSFVPGTIGNYTIVLSCVKMYR